MTDIYSHWHLEITAQDALGIVTLGSESPDYLFKAHREIKLDQVSESVCLSIAYMGEQIRELKDKNGKLQKENAKLRNKL